MKSRATKTLQLRLPTPEEIAVCAYLIWEGEGRPQGQAVAHWHQAEKQLLAIRLAEAGALATPNVSLTALTKFIAQNRRVSWPVPQAQEMVT